MSSEIEALVRSFEDCSLPVAEWTHREHLTVALWYLLGHPRDEATRRIRDGIQHYNLCKGNRNGYHETITLAWVSVITMFLAAHDRDRPVAELVDDLISACGDKDYLLRYYRRETLFSARAREYWVKPDLADIEQPAIGG